MRKMIYTGISNSREIGQRENVVRGKFHMFFQEGSQMSEDSGVDVGAIIEDELGRIIKVWDIDKIRFELD